MEILLFIGFELVLLAYIIFYNHRQTRCLDRYHQKELDEINDPDYFKVEEWIGDLGYNKFGKPVIKRFPKFGYYPHEF